MNFHFHILSLSAGLKIKQILRRIYGAYIFEIQNYHKRIIAILIYFRTFCNIVLYECQTWSLTLREEHKVRVLRRIFGPKRDEVTGGWRKLHNEELHNLYSSPKYNWNVRWAGNVTRMGDTRNAYRIFVGKPDGKSPLGRTKPRWVDNNKMDLREIG
jgi:hypothetical protein